VAKLAKDKSGKQVARVGVLGPDGKTYRNYDAQVCEGAQQSLLYEALFVIADSDPDSVGRR
jgi:hypothetical protein